MNDPESLLAQWLRRARRVMAFCGAGVSAESGLPTFRGAGGLWEGLPVQEVATPEAFQRDPGRVWRFYAWRQEGVAKAAPNAAHRALAGMEQRCDDFLLVSQNVDDLHERAGSRRLVKLHGSLMETRCPRCRQVTPVHAPIQTAGIAAGRLPRCDCGALLRPNVVWFGERLDPANLRVMADFLSLPLDLLLVIGTSGEVSGGYGILPAARAAGARIVELNPEASVLSAASDLSVRAPAAALFARIWPLPEM